MIDRKHIGYEFSPHTADVEKGRLRFFAKATGERNPIYTDEAVARAAGYRSLPVPPTFLFTMDLERPNPYEYLGVMGVDLGKILHGSQSFSYYHDVCAGDSITFATRVTDIFDKKEGALEFIVQSTSATNQDGVLVADMSKTIVVRNG